MGSTTTFLPGLLGRPPGNEDAIFLDLLHPGQKRHAGSSTQSVRECSGGHRANTEGQIMNGSQRKEEMLCLGCDLMLRVFSQRE